MSRYLFSFSKLGEMRFISHLDVQRLFRRALRRAKIELIYSQGFNPHPKINLVQPLSLGFESISDYFEIETLKEQDISSMISTLNESLPDGIMFTSGKELESGGKNLSSFVDFAEYKVFVPYRNVEDAHHNLSKFLSQDQIMVNKRSKKAKKIISTDVKNFVHSIEILSADKEGLHLHMVLRSASNESLNPLHIINAFCDFSSEQYAKESCLVVRQDLLFMSDGFLVPLFECDIK